MIQGEIGRENLLNWATNYIRNEATIKMDSLDDWHFLNTELFAKKMKF